MKSGWKRDAFIGVSLIIFVIFSLNVMRDWEKERMRTFLRSGNWDRLPISENIEYRKPEGCVTLFTHCLPQAGNVGE